MNMKMPNPKRQIPKALDKLETLLQHTQGKSMGNIDFQFNMNYCVNSDPPNFNTI